MKQIVAKGAEFCELNFRGKSLTAEDAEGVSEPRAVATGLGTQSSRLPSKFSMTPHKQSGRLRTQTPLAVL